MRPGNLEDFSTMSLIGTIGALVGGLFILFTWIWLGIVTPGLRKIVWIACLGLLLYFSGGAMVGAPIINFFLLFLPHGVVYAISIPVKIVGLLGLFYAWGMNFGRTNKAAMDYYRSRKICIVHRSRIQGTPFMCATCNVLYCTTCKDAVVRVDNKCWNCGAVLDTSTELSFRVRANDPIFQEFAFIKDELKSETDAEALRVVLKIGCVILEKRKAQCLGELKEDLEAAIDTKTGDIKDREITVSDGQDQPKKLR